MTDPKYMLTEESVWQAASFFGKYSTRANLSHEQADPQPEEGGGVVSYGLSELDF